MWSTETGCAFQPKLMRNWAFKLRSSPFLLFIAGLAVCFGLAHAETPANDARSSIQVSTKGRLLTLQVRNAPMDEVLRRIGSEVHLKIVPRGKLDTAITRSLWNLPVDVALRKLAGRHPTVMFYAPPAPGRVQRVLTEVWVYGLNSHASVIVQKPGIDPKLPLDLRGVDAAVRVQAIRNLGSPGRASVIDLLAQFAKEDPDAAVRSEAAAALGRVGNERAIPALQMLIDDANQSVRVRALRALARIGGRQATHVLGDTLTHSADRQMRLMAAWYLDQEDSAVARSYLETAAAAATDSIVQKAASRRLTRREGVENRSSDE
jgi:hypothetical protein